MRRLIELVLILSIASIAGCGGGTTAENPQTPASKPMIVYSIDGNQQVGSADDPNLFHGYEILGQMQVETEEKQREIRAAIQDALEGSDGTVAGCFIPRHGVRVEEGTVWIDYVICFECFQMEVHTADAGRRVMPITDTSRDMFNDTLTDAGIELAP